MRITFVNNVHEAAKFHDQYNKFWRTWALIKKNWMFLTKTEFIERKLRDSMYHADEKHFSNALMA